VSAQPGKLFGSHPRRAFMVAFRSVPADIP
jgi:hypothetical protein